MQPSLQHYLPQHALSRFAGLLANCRIPWLKNALIRYFVNRYPVNLAEAENPNPYDYASFNEFFTRRLKPGLRKIANDQFDFSSPADGYLSESGDINNNCLLQAKNHHYTATDLLGGEEKLAKFFEQGSFITLYLAPHNYHRVHMPLTGELEQMIYIPGRLFSVNFRTSSCTPNLFANNERVVSIFNTEFGKMAVVLVGAMIVGSIEMVCEGTIQVQSEIKRWTYDKNTNDKNKPVVFQRGEEMGLFKLGSTVIVLSEKKVAWESSMHPKDEVLLGQRLGQFI